MPEKDPLDDAAAAVIGFFTRAYAEQPALLDSLAAEQAAQAQRLGAAAERLRKLNGPDDPRAAQLTRQAAGADRMQANLRTIATRQQRRPAPKPGEWMVYGTLVDPEGHPVAGLRVRLLDHDGKLGQRLGASQSDEFGDFAIVFSERAFFEQGPDLFVTVDDGKGNLLFSSADNVRFNAGQAEYFLITLPERPRGSVRPGPTPKPTSKRRSPGQPEGSRSRKARAKPDQADTDQERS
jgi:hypothetical protein